LLLYLGRYFGGWFWVELVPDKSLITSLIIS
jgi:hypothetical protein